MTSRVKIGGVYIDIDGDNSGYKRELKDSERASGRTHGRMQRDFRQTTGTARLLDREVQRTRTSMIALGAAAGAALGGAAVVRTLADFSQAMSTVQAVTGATEAQMKALEAQAKLLGSTTRFSASQAAEGMIFLARAGFDVDEVLGSITGTLQLAQAGGLELGRAADIASNVLSGFNLEISESGRVVDILAKAANSANTDVNQLGEALKFAAPTAVALGLDIEETVAIIGKLSDAGIQAGLAGRGFQSLGTQFENQRPKIEALIGEYDLAEEGLAALVRRLDEAGITTKQVIEIFRAENLDVFTILRNASFDAEGGLDALEQKLRDAGGTAEQVAATMDDNLNGALLATASALEAFVLELGAVGAESAATQALQGLAELLRLAAANADVVAAALVALSVRAVLPLAISMGTNLVASARAAMAQMAALEAISGRTIGTVGKLRIALTALGGPVTLAISAAAAAMVYLATSSKDASDRLDEAAEAMDKITGIRETIAEDTEALADANERLTRAMENQGKAAQTTAALEVQSLEDRIKKNRELIQVYQTLAAAALSSAEQEFQEEDRAFRKKFSKRYERVRDGYNRDGTVRYRTRKRALSDTEIDNRRDRIVSAREAGESISDADRKFLEALGDREELRLRLINQQEAYDELKDALAKPQGDNLGGDFRDLLDPVDGDGDKPKPEKTDAEKAAEARAAAREREKAALREILDLESALELAEAQGNAQRVADLEDELEIRARIEQYKRAGIEATEAETRARSEVAALRELENAAAARLLEIETLRRELEIESARGDTLKAQQLETQLLILERTNELIAEGVDLVEAQGQAYEDIRRLRQAQGEGALSDLPSPTATGSTGFVADPKELSEFEKGIRDRTKSALLEAMETGDWSEAFGGALEDAAREGLRNAVSDGIDLLFDLLKDTDFGGLFSGGGGGFLSSIGSLFGGAKAGGGDVSSGRAYLVGEMGPEWFVPGADGTIIPNKSTAPTSAGNIGPSGGISVRGGDVIVQGDASEKTLDLIRDSQAEFAQHLPGMIRQEVSDGQRRGRF